MRVLNFLVSLLFLIPPLVFGAAPLQGKERLRELAVIPTVHLSSGFQIRPEDILKLGEEEAAPAGKIVQLQKELKSHEDTSLRIQLAKLLEKAGSTNEARACYAEAEKILRARSESEPKNGLLLVDLANAVAGLGHRDEAVALCRRATEVSPKESKCWAELGSWLNGEFFKMWKPGIVMPDSYSPEKLASAFMAYRPSADALERAEAGIKEAGECFDRAVALQPESSQFYLRRAGQRQLAAMMNCFSRSFRNNENPDFKKLVQASFAPEAISNFEAAAKWSPRSPCLIAWIPYLHFFSLASEQHSDLPADQMSPSLRRSFDEAASRLEELGHDPNSKLAAESMEALGMLYGTIMQNDSAAKPYLARAVALDKTRDGAWEVLLGLSVSSPDSAHESVALCESRLKVRDTARNHLLFAKALAKDQKWDRAVAEAKVAAERDSENAVPQLLLAALEITRGTDEESVTTILNYLKRANALITQMPKGEEREEQMRDCVLNLALLCGLGGEVERGREIIETFLKISPEDEKAKEILSALQSLPTK